MICIRHTSTSIYERISLSIRFNIEPFNKENNYNFETYAFEVEFCLAEKDKDEKRQKY